MIIGGKNFDTANHTYIMGILNVTPDSFSDGGKFNGMDAAIAHAHRMVEEGVDIIDVGGESTRPGHIQITDEEEIARVTPIIEVLKKEFDVPVSIDTYKSHVAEAALQAGADLVNDIWGLKYDKKMASVIAKYQAACCLMHNREKAEYQDFLKDFMDDMKECVRLAKAAGIEDDKIILDPGVGFGKTYEMNLEIIDKMEILNELGDPWLIAKTIINAGVPEEKNAYDSSENNDYQGYGRRSDYDGMKVYRVDTWWKKALLIVGVIAVIGLILSLITGVVSLLAPVLVPILIIAIIINLLKR